MFAAGYGAPAHAQPGYHGGQPNTSHGGYGMNQQSQGVMPFAIAGRWCERSRRALPSFFLRLCKLLSDCFLTIRLTSWQQGRGRRVSFTRRRRKVRHTANMRVSHPKVALRARNGLPDDASLAYDGLVACKVARAVFLISTGLFYVVCCDWNKGFLANEITLVNQCLVCINHDSNRHHCALAFYNFLETSPTAPQCL
jgi:hypothetical protein